VSGVLYALFLTTTAGTRPPLLTRTCVCASQKSFFRRKTFATQYKSGGRKPHVGTPHANATTGDHGKPAPIKESAPLWFITATAPAFVGTLPAASRDFAEAPLQVRYPRPRRADARRSWLCVRSSLNNIRFSRHTDRTTEPRRADARSSCFRT
jgi:hypothetical protein